jgi:hypothetical protein
VHRDETIGHEKGMQLTGVETILLVFGWPNSVYDDKEVVVVDFELWAWIELRTVLNRHRMEFEVLLQDG